MLYILARDATDATVFARKRLGIYLRQQGKHATAVCNTSHLPSQIGPEDEVRATPMFAAILEESSKSLHRVRCLLVATAVEKRGGVIIPPFDLPSAMDRESIEDWLSR